MNISKRSCLLLFSLSEGENKSEPGQMSYWVLGGNSQNPFSKLVSPGKVSNMLYTAWTNICLVCRNHWPPVLLVVQQINYVFPLARFMGGGCRSRTVHITWWRLVGETMVGINAATLWGDIIVAATLLEDCWALISSLGESMVGYDSTPRCTWRNLLSGSFST